MSKTSQEKAQQADQEIKPAASSEPGNGGTEGQEVSAGEEEKTTSLIEIYTFANTLPRELIELQNDIDRITDVNKLRGLLPLIETQIEALDWKAIELKANPNLTFHELNLYEGALVKLSHEINTIDQPVRANIETLETWYRAWIDQEKRLEPMKARVAAHVGFGDALPDFSTYAETIAIGKKLIEEQLRINLLLGRDIGKLHTKQYELNDTASDLAKAMNEAGIEQTAPSMLSAEFYKRISRRQFIESWQNIHLFWLYQRDYLKQHLNPIIFGLILVLLLTYCLHWSKSLVNPTSTWYSFAARPLMASVYILGTAFGLVSAMKIYLTLPPNWDSLLFLPLIAALGVFANEVVKSRWQVRLLRQLLTLLAVFLIITAVNLPMIIIHLLVFLSSALLLTYYLFRFLQYRIRSGTNPVGWTVVVWGVFPLIIIVAGLAGYDQMAVTLYGRILSFIAVTLIIRLLHSFTIGLLEMALTHVPWEIINRNAKEIVRQVTPLFALIYVLLWVAATLVIFWVYPTLKDPVDAIAALRFTIFDLIVSPKALLTLIFIVYATVLVSRGIRAFLRQDILPRYGVDIGVQISITRLVHYAILVIGFFVLLNLLGFELNQITILGGALGVGIGFGLQAIVNNFVSGLILLFERPIKVGDMLEVGQEQIGEVKELGLRATTVQTFDNAEIVIPNSELVTGSVTNWTLAEKKVRVRVPVGVAYGSDIAKVLEILLTCANEHPAVLSTPKPVALFLAFGNSSLDFELRAWISDFSDRLNVISELNQQIEVDFDLANVVIPFPQTDLHIKSINRDVAEKLSS